MHNKNNNKTQTYIQGLRPFSTSIPKALRKHLRKGGYNYSSIVDNWTKIVNKKISDVSYPITVKMGKEMRDGTLVLNVVHGNEMKIEYEKSSIKDKINSFFGYSCINKVTLKIVQNKIEKLDNTILKIKDLRKIENKMKKIHDNNLRNSLNNFLRSNRTI